MATLCASNSRLGVARSSVSRPALRGLPALTSKPAILGARSRVALTPSATAEAIAPPSSSNDSNWEKAVDWSDLSYSKQYDLLYSHLPLDTKRPIGKPNREAQRQEPNGHMIMFSDVKAVPKKPTIMRKWNTTDLIYLGFIGGMHLLACAAPFTFSWPMLWLFLGSYFVTGCLGITLSFHRQLSHKSFTTPKWVEYVLAYCGVLAVQGDPLEWVSAHRYHHLHTETPLDPHSIYEGFWFSHVGWLLDNESTMDRVSNRTNAAEMEAQWYYRFLRDTYMFHVVAQYALLYAFGGLPAVVWGGALRTIWVWHITWFVNSACHVWGNQTYNTGDESRNNWWVGILAYGEGWHNNHHAFEFSARHGLEPHQFDMTWLMICFLEKLGLAKNIKLPTEKQLEKLRINPST